MKSWFARKLINLSDSLERLAYWLEPLPIAVPRRIHQSIVDRPFGMPLDDSIFLSEGE